MMLHEQWLNRILEVAREIASRQFQQEAWLSGRPSTSSPTEIYNQLFDDYSFDLFFETYSKGLTLEQTAAWTEFKLALEKFGEKFPVFPNERIVFEDPDWQKVVGRRQGSSPPSSRGTRNLPSLTTIEFEIYFWEEAWGRSPC